MKQICKLMLSGLFIFGTVPCAAYCIQVSEFPIGSSSNKIIGDITIGHRTNDSTGTLNISNAAIQQSIIPAISFLNNTTVTSDNSALLINLNTVYLRFNIIDTAGVKSYIAVQLSENSSGDFSFHPGEGKELHILTNSATCSSCMYIKELGRIGIANCTGDPCKYSIHY